MNDIEKRIRAAEIATIHKAAQKIVRLAISRGLVLTIEQVPLKPLQMGNERTIVEVRAARWAV